MLLRERVFEGEEISYWQLLPGDCGVWSFYLNRNRPGLALLAARERIPELLLRKSKNFTNNH